MYELNAAAAADPDYHPFGDRSGIEDEAED